MSEPNQPNNGDVPPRAVGGARTERAGGVAAPIVAVTAIIPTDLMDEDEAVHARVDDPVVPPARMPKEYDSSGTPVARRPLNGPGSGTGDSILSRLFDPDRKQKPALWTHIKLVAPGPADEPPPGCLKWRSKDAVAAYCLKCRKQFTYTKGTSKTISRHMTAFHGLMSTDGEFRDDDDEDDDDADDDDDLGRGDGNDRTATNAVASILGNRHRRKGNLGGGAGGNGGSSGGGPPLKKRKTSYGNNSTQAAATSASSTSHGSMGITGGAAHRSSGSSSSHHNNNSNSSLALLKWLIGSYHPFALVHGGTAGGVSFPGSTSKTFAAFCRTLNPSFRLPSVATLIRLANQRYHDVRNLIQQDVRNECDYFSVSVRKVTTTTAAAVPAAASAAAPSGDESKPAVSPCRVFYPVQITFCSSQFGKRSYAVAVVEGTAVGDPTDRTDDGNDKKEEVEVLAYIRAIDAALDQHGLSRDRVTNVTLGDMASGTVPMTELPNPWVPCSVLETLDGIVLDAIQTHLNDLMNQITDAQRKQEGEGQEQPAHNDGLADIFPSQKAYQSLLHASKVLGADMSPVDAPTVPAILSILLPFHDAMQTLSGDAYPTVGLTIPVLRRIRDVLESTSIGSAEDKGHADGGVGSNGDDDKEDKTTTGLVKAFFTTIQGEFTRIFATVLDTNPPLVWTMPLDPRLVSMSSLSEEEKAVVVETLTGEVKALVKEINKQNGGEESLKEPPALNVEVGPVEGAANGDDGKSDTAATNTKGGTQKQDAPTANTATDTPTANTMGGIFWGEDDAAKFETEKEKEDYATKNVQSYFNTVRSQRRIDDPLLWWKNNQHQFPELATLARRWMGASALYSGPLSCRGDNDNVIHPSSLPLEMAIFLHDNLDLI